MSGTELPEESNDQSTKYEIQTDQLSNQPSQENTGPLDETALRKIFGVSDESEKKEPIIQSVGKIIDQNGETLLVFQTSIPPERESFKRVDFKVTSIIKRPLAIIIFGALRYEQYPAKLIPGAIKISLPGKDTLGAKGENLNPEQLLNDTFDSFLVNSKLSRIYTTVGRIVGGRVLIRDNQLSIGGLSLDHISTKEDLFDEHDLQQTIEIDSAATYVQIMRDLLPDNELTVHLEQETDTEMLWLTLESVNKEIARIHNIYIPTKEPGEPYEWGSSQQLREKILGKGGNLEYFDKILSVDNEKNILHEDIRMKLQDVSRLLRTKMSDVFDSKSFYTREKDFENRQDNVCRRHANFHKENIFVYNDKLLRNVRNKRAKKIKYYVDIIDCLNTPMHPEFYNIDSLSDHTMLPVDILVTKRDETLIFRLINDYIQKMGLKGNLNAWRVYWYYFMEKLAVRTFAEFFEKAGEENPDPQAINAKMEIYVSYLQKYLLMFDPTAADAGIPIQQS